MNEIEYVLGSGDGIVHDWSGQAELADTGIADTLWLDFDGDTSNDEVPWDRDGPAALDSALLPDIPQFTVDHRAVLAQETASPLSRPPWLDGS
ncbi:hypothetical protein [Nocardia rhizosphaerihabitans]|uniref:hypothetical protein n=1 Tax=Nocardia rhizosphaerihabitans TaxID=1691570 RepID=UPI001665A0CE|nr:hypothetical protein [Nocardia rhizosphaerihabitans]